jgi:hypothetical protein
MKIIDKYAFILISTILLLSACAVNEDSEAVFAQNELPKIFLTSWSASQSVAISKVLKYTPQVSPSDGATYKWILGPDTISREKDLEYTVVQAVGTYDFKFEVERNGRIIYRTAILKVTK